MPWCQPSLKEVLLGKPPSDDNDGGDAPVVEVYDFFAGAGGFSTGASQAGCRVVWACDNDPLALETHKRNHPLTEHRLAELPMQRNEWPFPTDGRAFHAHFSPPCQKFSDVNQTHRVEGDRHVAEGLVEWSLETALTCGAQTWSLEQVPNAAVIALVEAAKQRHPGRVTYARVDFSHLGVPQTRTRLIAGSPDLVAQLLRRLDRANRTTVRSAIAKPRGTHVRNGKGWVSQKRALDGSFVRTKAGWGDNCHTIDEPAPTVLAHRELSWVTRREDGYDHGHLRPNEMAALQTFPPTYSWPDSLKRCLIEIGNAVPPLVAQLLLAPLAVASGRTAPSSSSSSSNRLRQPSLLEMLRAPAPSASSPPPPPLLARQPLEVYDFFAGAGGFSTGAAQAGCRVVWVCDSDRVALETHAANHPGVEHCLTELPMPRSAWPFPTDGRPFHAHFSPPCQKFSRINKRNRTPGDAQTATDLVTWSLETAIACGAASWSLEQVAAPAVVALVEAARVRHPGRIAYAKIDLAQLGVPQRRVRLIAGPPALIAPLLRRRDASNTRSVRSAIAKPRGTHLRHGLGWTHKSRGVDGKWRYVKADWNDHCSRIDAPAPTVLSDRGMNWVTRRKGVAIGPHPRLRKHEYAALQTFPSTYQWPAGEQLALKQIGNAVPPLVAQLLLRMEVRSPPPSDYAQDDSDLAED